MILSILYSNIIREVYFNAFANLAMIVLFASLAAFLKYSKGNKLINKILKGLFIGGLVIIVMSTPFQLADGLQFDARTIILSLTGLLYGPIPAFIAFLFAFVYRIIIGGEGVYVGLSTIITSTLIGILWSLKQKHKIKNKYVNFLLFGFIVNIIGLLSFLALDLGVVFWYLVPVFSIIFPLTTLFLALIIERQDELGKLIKENNNQRLLLKYSIDSTPFMEIYAVDENYNYLVFNEFHQKSMKNYYDIDIKIGDNFLSYITNVSMKARLKENFDQALLGKTKITNSEVEVTRGKFLEEHFTSIANEKDEIIGVSVFSYEITERKNKENEVIYLSYRDQLTKTFNRRYFDELIQVYKENGNKSFSLVSIDVNGLKLVNDTFGHKHGDELLIKVAKLLTENLSKDDVVCRVGGDEFYLIISNTNKKKSLAVMEKIKYIIDKTKIRDVNISISYGLSTKDDKKTIEQVLQEAENMMYRNKLFESKNYRKKSIETILEALNEKREGMKEHLENVAELSVRLSTRLNLSVVELGKIKMISKLHDIGKIVLNSDLLNKPTKLTEQEMEEVNKHCEVGFRILSVTEDYGDIAYDILSHHERYDGLGYPRGLAKEEIPFKARIVSVCDAYDAMVSYRPYRKSKSKEEALKEIKYNLGKQFDPIIGEEFIKMMEEVQND